MIKIESLEIHEFRGLRELSISLDRSTLVVFGPNGSGKSGIVDAIQFALTGTIERLTGAGTGDLTLAEHGPHILARSTPDTAWVKLTAFIPSLNATASLTRSVKKPGQPKFSPDTPEVIAVFNSIARHPEISLSRREIIKFILSADGQRSTDVQNLLQLSEIGATRSALNTSLNQLVRARDAAKAARTERKRSLSTHFEKPTLSLVELLQEANARRLTLSLPPLPELYGSTDLTDGLKTQDTQPKGAQGRDSALRDVDLLGAIIGGEAEDVMNALTSANAGLRRLELEPALGKALKRLELIEAGIPLVDADECPLCERDWDAAALRAFLERKLAESREATQLKEAIERSAVAIADAARRVLILVESITKLPEAGDLRSSLGLWRTDLKAFAKSLETVRGIWRSRHRLAADWTGAPEEVRIAMPSLRKAILERPAQTEVGAARDFLTIAQERFDAWRTAARELRRREQHVERAEFAYKTYVSIADATLTSLYRTVENEFSAYYRVINEDEDGTFQARLTPSDSTLQLGVDFFGHGLCPPAAYHSEGHQDGMGLCLFLALARQSLADDLTLVVLDDVVMSVDAGHRRNICRLLKSAFPNTQFVITTHDQVWARQMRSEGLVDSKHTLAFHSWSVETGPILNDVTDVWSRIDQDLAIDDVPSAAAKLRRHLEFVCGELADILAAPISYRGDGAYDLGDLMPAVIGRQKSLLGSAAKAANSWNQQDEVSRIGEFRAAFSAAQTRQNDEAWMVNKSVHFVDWANLSAGEFRSLASAYQGFLGLWRCPKCDSWLSLSSRHNARDLRCSCSQVRFNLAEKGK